MAASIYINDQIYHVDNAGAIDVSIPLIFNGPQPNAYGVEQAVSEPCRADDLVGDTRRGGSCNFEQYTFIPHCSGTHTECVGHITHERLSVRDCLQDVFMRAALISVEPVAAGETDEGYAADTQQNDLLITRRLLQDAFGGAAGEFEALIIRTQPNDETKKTRQYGDGDIPAYFSTDAMEYILETGIRHLLVDLPSIDRLFDDGKLSNHRIFWDVEQESFETNAASRINNTITELIYVPSDVEDGEYLLNLQIAPFAADASPSRPIIFRI